MKTVFAADLAVLKSENKLTLILPLFYMVFGLASPFFRVFCTVLTVTLVINAMAYNERSGFDRGLLVLPVSRKTVVLSRYAEALGLSACMLAVLCLLSQFIRLDNARPMNLREFFVLLGTTCLYVDIMFPFLIKLTVEKGRTVYVILMMLAAACASSIFSLGGTVMSLLSVLLPVAGILGTVFFCLVSIKYYEHREF